MISNRTYSHTPPNLPNWNASTVPGALALHESLMGIHAEFIGKTLSTALNDHLSLLTERVVSLFMRALNDGKSELKRDMASCLAKVLTPIFINQPYPDLPEKYKAMILAAIDGAEAFFEDLDQALASTRGRFETNDMLQLQSGRHDADAFEDKIIDKMNIRLRKQHLQPIVPLPHNEQEMESNLCYTTKNLLKSVFPPSSKSSLERETLLVLAGLYLSKTADFVFSSYTLLHLLDKFLNHPQAVENKIKEFPLSFPDAPFDMKFANSLDERFHRLLNHAFKLGATGIANQFLLSILIRFILYAIRGAIGKGCAKAIQATIQSPSSATVLAWGVDLFYRESGKERAKIPILLSSVSNPDLMLCQYKYHIATAIKEHRLFEKINTLIKDALSEGVNLSSSDKKLLFCACRNIAVDSTTIKSLCDNFTRKLFILFQRKRLLKMLYCYMAEYTRKSIKEARLNNFAIQARQSPGVEIKKNKFTL